MTNEETSAYLSHLDAIHISAGDSTQSIAAWREFIRFINDLVLLDHGAVMLRLEINDLYRDEETSPDALAELKPLANHLYRRLNA